ESASICAASVVFSALAITHLCLAVRASLLGGLFLGVCTRGNAGAAIDESGGAERIKGFRLVAFHRSRNVARSPDLISDRVRAGVSNAAFDEPRRVLDRHLSSPRRHSSPPSLLACPRRVIHRRRARARGS